MSLLGLGGVDVSVVFDDVDFGERLGAEEADAERGLLVGGELVTHEMAAEWWERNAAPRHRLSARPRGRPGWATQHWGPFAETMLTLRLLWHTIELSRWPALGCRDA